MKLIGLQAFLWLESLSQQGVPATTALKVPKKFTSRFSCQIGKRDLLCT